MFRTVLTAAARPLAITGLLATLVAMPAHAEQDDEVVARVNGTEITQTDLALVGVDYAKDLMQVPEAMRPKVLTDVMVDMHVLADAARKAGLDEDPEFKKHIAYLETRALRDAFFRKNVALETTDEELKASYDAKFADFEGPDERHARHILVKTEEEAKAVIAELDAGKDFAELAKEKSTGPSGPSGGDLGFFTKGRMVPAFEDAAFSLEIGAYTKTPVETQFGWHVIKAEEDRKQPAPAFEAVKNNLREDLLRTRFQEVMAKLKAEATIEIVKVPGSDQDAPDAPETSAQ
ncbi:peptidylprolyl isomerase [Breoghania sp. L-A4]|uniref:peptidylprolyl isomerase n=1 Tax=Breoghania sp. L-A4 TaxID=2304600 RepID=UPI000E35A64E|nr:peptidylprolyl isomerase [Breoghania sp. L-A4]AXS42037.1 peptidylprolyl isomerase [Breoghania sp. L-A4]